jgi:hypothetical protein
MGGDRNQKQSVGKLSYLQGISIGRKKTLNRLRFTARRPPLADFLTDTIACVTMMTELLYLTF